VPATAGTIAEILRDNGYNTFAVGNTALRRMKKRPMPVHSITGNGKGFDHFFDSSARKPTNIGRLGGRSGSRPSDGRHLSDRSPTGDLLYRPPEEGRA